MAELPQISALQNPINIVQGETGKTIVIDAISPDGGTISYQWYENTKNSYSGSTELYGEISNTLILPSDSVGKKYYYCFVINTKDGQTGLRSTIIEVNTKSADSYLSMLLNDKKLLVDVLNSKGIPSTYDETYDSLIPKVNLITKFELPIASTTTLGGVKVGENLAIDGNGVLSAVASGDGSNIVECTKSEYLSWEQAGTLEKDTLYVITDIGFNMEEIAEKAHTHENKSVLDTVTTSVVNNSHSHENKSVLDTVTTSVVNNSHTHENKDLLDNLSSNGSSNQFLAADGQYHEMNPGEHISIDSSLSDTSENPVQNKVIKEELDKINIINIVQPCLEREMTTLVKENFINIKYRGW